MDSARPAGSSAGVTIFEPEDSCANALFSSLVDVSRLLAAVMADMFVFKLLITICLTLSLSHPVWGASLHDILVVWRILRRASSDFPVGPYWPPTAIVLRQFSIGSEAGIL